MYKYIEDHYIVNRNKLVKRMSFRAGSIEAAEDIIQTAYERALRYCNTCDFTRFNQWFSMLINNAFHDYRNEERGYSDIEADVDDNPDTGCPHYSDRIISEVYELVDTKSESQIEILSLHLKHGYRPIDIARITEYSYAKCWQVIERFRNEVRELYSE